MAELLLAKGWAEPDSLVMYLREALPDEYMIVADPTVHGRAVDAVVVGPQGIFVLYVKDWEGEICPARHGPWRGQLASGREVRYPNPAEEVRHATRALRAFLRDEFPSLRPTVWHFVVFMSPNVKLTGSETAEPPAVTREAVAEEITSMEAGPEGPSLDEEMRGELAVALRDRKLTASQRASEPFVFRSDGLFGSGKKVWTIRAAVQRMDKHPEDGIYHLRNGTLAQWLSDQGAEHLAELAREVMRQEKTHHRIALETFLLGTGLVRRPPLSVRPKRINLGYILSGETSRSHLRVCKGRGRGYLFGTLQTSDPWLVVEPRTFVGGPLQSVVSVSAKTGTLLISPTSYQPNIYVESNASEEPVAVPVHFRVVGMPSCLNRYLVRPLVGLISAGLLGAGVGWSLGHWGIQAPGWLMGLTSGPISSAAVWAVLIGLFWAVGGGIRGYFQRLAWPISYAMGRWLLRTLVWGAGLSLLATTALWCWRQLHADPGMSMVHTSRVSTVLLALAFAIVPAARDEIGRARSAKGAAVSLPGRSLLRPLLLAAIGIALMFVLVAGSRVIGPVWQQFDVDGAVASAQGWAGDQWIRLESGLNGFMDQLYVRYYDRRAPVQATPAPTALPTTEGGAP